MDSLLSTIPKVFRDVDTDEAATKALAFAAWSRVAGEGIRKSAQPVELIDETLVVAVRDAAWSANLTSLAPQLLARLSGELGHGVIKFLEFRTEPRQFGLKAISAGVAEDDISSLDPRLIEAAEAIAEPKLRQNFLAAAAAYLDRQTPAK